MNIPNEVDMLKGNINRMCVTDDVEELKKMYKWGKFRIDMLYEKRISELNSINHKE